MQNYFFQVATCTLVGFLSIAFAQGVSMDVVIGMTAKFECYLSSLTNQYDGFFVDIMFRSSIPNSKEQKIASYNPGISTVSVQDTSFSNRLSFDNSGQMIISFVGLPDEGTYTCHPRAFSITPGLEKTTSITVQVPPEVQVKKVNDPLIAGSSIVDAAKCVADGGKPPAKVYWKTDRNLGFSESVTSNNGSSTMTTVISTLQVKPIKFYNKQPFICTVEHPAFTENNVTTIYLVVNYSPGLPVITVDNDNTFLTCSADGNPAPTYKWLMPQGAPSSEVLGPKADLVQPDDPAHDNDTYTCIASNGVGEPRFANITTHVAITVVALTNQANVGAIVGAVIGGIAALVIIIALVYFFVIKRQREKDDGPYPQRSSLVDYNTDGYSGRPTIEHANDSLNKQRPRSPSRPPPDETLDAHSQSSSDSGDEGEHDVSQDDPATTLVEPAPYDNSDNGITSRSSMNFRPYGIPSSFEARRKRPSTSPAYRKSRNETEMQGRDSPASAPRPGSRYDLPPSDGYDDDMEAQSLQPKDDYPEQGYNDGYPYRQPSYVAYPERQQQPPYRTDSLPQYEPKYADIDHSSYGQDSSPRIPSSEEPVEYAQIRHGYSHVV